MWKYFYVTGIDILASPNISRQMKMLAIDGLSYDEYP